ncbi:MAG: hypothetical protein LUD72_04605 [Bacteroidales bacterium]|nr:hypothetical protein [Bacteroidales bacterium]
MVKLTMQTGEEVELTISHLVLKKVEKELPEATKYTDRYYEAMGGGALKDTRETIERSYELVYVGYLCGMEKQDKLKEALDYDSFEMNLPEDDQLIVFAATALISPNRTRDFEAYSKEQAVRTKTKTR